MSSEIAIKVESLSKCYHIYDRPRDRLLQMLARGRRQYFREFWALSDVSFEIKKGETVGIIGRNGSGKSTLLQMICGTLNPTSGSIRTHGRIAALLELGSGFNPEFTGRENVYLNAAVLGLKNAEIDARFDDIAAFADIGEFMGQPVKTYSSGMMVRLAFAVQAMVDPDILIVDEALAVGDEKFQRKCFARLEELKAKGTSIILVSHSGPQVVELCDRAVLLDHGIRLMYATPMQAVRAYQNLIYAPQDQERQLIEKYLASDWNGGSEEHEGTGASTAIDLPHDDDAFDPGLIPETTVLYPIQGAEIQGVQILSAEGRLVNVLQAGRAYRFVVSGRFLSDIDAVYWGIHIRTISGVEVTGQRYPEEGKYLRDIKAGQKFSMSFEFKMLAVPGTYFAGAGVWSSGQPACLHRVMDAIMFRVSNPEQSYSFGYCDLSAASPVVEFSEAGQ